MLDKSLRQQFVIQRRYIQRRNKILEEKGLPTLEVPKLKELKSNRQLQKELQKIEQWREEKRGTIKGAHEWIEEQERKKKEREEERRAQRERKRKERNERRREQRREQWIEDQPERKQWFINYMEEKHGLKIQNEKEFKQLTDYINKRKSMQSRKDKYEMERFVDEYNRLKEKGAFKGGGFKQLLKDFDAFKGDQKQLEKRMKKMKLRYDKGFIDQLYSEFLNKRLQEWQP